MKAGAGTGKCRPTPSTTTNAQSQEDCGLLFADVL